nr:Abi family protein [uncultured Enterobacter sp.]
MRPFKKPAMSPAEQLEQWHGRGLIIPDNDRAIRYLSHISYYRLSAYAIPFYKSGDDTHFFKNGTNFDDILSLYIFDRELRLLVLDAVERVEVAIRAQLCNHMAMQYNNNPFWYLDESLFRPEYGHKRLLADLERQIDDERRRYENDVKHLDKRKQLTTEQKDAILRNLSQETFLRHYICNYDQPRLPPCWMMVEMLTWGNLSHLYSGLFKASDQKAIASAVGCNAELLTSWMKSLNTIRNHCAHHSRLWNREFGLSIKIPNSDRVRWLKHSPNLADKNIRYEKRLYSILAALQCLMYTINPSSKWALRLKELLQRYPHVSLSHMGIPDDWVHDPFWSEALSNNH